MPTRRAVSVSEILRKKFIEMPVEGEWKALLGRPARNGVWHIKGTSGQGKTTLLMKMAKYLTRFGRVAYNSLEEGARKSMQEAIIDADMESVKKDFILLDREPIDELDLRLSKKRSPDIIIIDSIQYAGLTKSIYKNLVDKYPDKLFIFNSHAEGRKNVGAIARDIEFDADIKIDVEDQDS